jgi:hypothetical protein
MVLWNFDENLEVFCEDRAGAEAEVCGAVANQFSGLKVGLMMLRRLFARQD